MPHGGLTPEQRAELDELIAVTEGRPGIFRYSDDGAKIWALFEERPQHSGEVMLTRGTLEALSQQGFITLRSDGFMLRRGRLPAR